MRRETRAAVGLIAPRSRPRISAVHGCTAHWNGPPLRLAGKPHSACQQAWRNIQRFHMGKYYTPNPSPDGRHWQDVAYTFAVCHHGVAMDGRGKDVRTAANGTKTGNDHWYACFFMIGTGEEPSREMLAAAEWYARTVLGTTRWNRHADHKATTCAGTVNKYVSGGRIDTMSAVPAPGYKLGDRVLSLQDPMLRGEDVTAWQAMLNRWSSEAKLVTDGVFGPKANHWSGEFMREVMGVTTDSPKVGPKTVAAMRAELEEPQPKDPPMTRFSDVPKDHPHAEGIEAVAEAELFKGYPDGTFRPGEPVTRAQLATVLSRLLKK